VRLGTTPTLGADLLPGVLALARAEQPGLQLDLVVDGDSATLVDGVRSGALDLAFATLAGGDHDGLDIAVAGPQTFVLVIPADHPLASTRVVTHRHLAHEPVVALRGGQGLRTVLDAVFAGIGAEPTVSVETPERELLIRVRHRRAWRHDRAGGLARQRRAGVVVAAATGGHARRRRRAH
jgi:DNA-binding transcriptional LysR family regulator